MIFGLNEQIIAYYFKNPSYVAGHAVLRLVYAPCSFGHEWSCLVMHGMFIGEHFFSQSQSIIFMLHQVTKLDANKSVNYGLMNEAWWCNSSFMDTLLFLKYVKPITTTNSQLSVSLE